ncbi:MAG: hypothetical protein F6J93_35755 [Oscillatoria sp. SIO1A7]|nr:hypothetical protein [Oscillatoria sp. SIO1A7]
MLYLVYSRAFYVAGETAVGANGRSPLLAGNFPTPYTPHPTPHTPHPPHPTPYPLNPTP